MNNAHIVIKYQNDKFREALGLPLNDYIYNKMQAGDAAQNRSALVECQVSGTVVLICRNIELHFN